MSVLFNHARRYDLYDRNPIQWVRQSAKRRSTPEVLTSNEVRRLLTALKPRERMMVLLDVATGLRQSELFALKWKDVDFKNRRLLVTRSIVQQVVGNCKTEASQKPVPVVRQNFSRGPKRDGSGGVGVNTIVDSVQQEDPKTASPVRVERAYIKDRPKVDPNYAARL
jgi:integrase